MNDLIDEDEEAETAEFVEKFLREMTPRLEQPHRQILGLGSGMVSIEGALWAQRRIFEGCALLCAGLPPHHKERNGRATGGRGWAELVGLMDANARLAIRHVGEAEGGTWLVG